MLALGLWRAVCVLCYVGAVVCVNGDEYEVNYADSYGNEITDQQEGEPHAAPCQAPEFPRWDQLFIALENSHMRQNMLLQALETLDQRCGGAASLGARVAGLEAACRGPAEQASPRLQPGLAELRAEGAERERRLNATLQSLLLGSQEQSGRLRRLEEEAGGQRAEASGEGALTPGAKEQEVAAVAAVAADMAKMERALVTMTTELQKVQAQLSGLASEGGQRRRRRREAEGRGERRN